MQRHKYFIFCFGITPPCERDSWTSKRSDNTTALDLSLELRRRNNSINLLKMSFLVDPHKREPLRKIERTEDPVRKPDKRRIDGFQTGTEFQELTLHLTQSA